MISLEGQLPSGKYSSWWRRPPSRKRLRSYTCRCPVGGGGMPRAFRDRTASPSEGRPERQRIALGRRGQSQQALPPHGSGKSAPEASQTPKWHAWLAALPPPPPLQPRAAAGIAPRNLRPHPPLPPQTRSGSPSAIANQEAHLLVQPHHRRHAPPLVVVPVVLRHHRPETDIVGGARGGAAEGCQLARQDPIEVAVLNLTDCKVGGARGRGGGRERGGVGFRWRVRVEGCRRARAFIVQEAASRVPRPPSRPCAGSSSTPEEPRLCGSERGAPTCSKCSYSSMSKRHAPPLASRNPRDAALDRPRRQSWVGWGRPGRGAGEIEAAVRGIWFAQASPREP
jgi:hypothetical protein